MLVRHSPDLLWRGFIFSFALDFFIKTSTFTSNAAAGWRERTNRVCYKPPIPGKIHFPGRT